MALIPSQRVELVDADAAAACACQHQPAWARGDSALLQVAGGALVVRLAPCQRCDLLLLGVTASPAEDADPTWYVVDDGRQLVAE